MIPNSANQSQQTRYWTVSYLVHSSIFRLNSERVNFADGDRQGTARQRETRSDEVFADCHYSVGKFIAAR
jgi:hypothetical protein